VGAADFYYGEMEMRRHDRTTTSRAERGLLHAYWMLSGYGLRALGWLAAAMLITLVLLMSFGLPKWNPKQEATGTVPPNEGKVTFHIDKDDPQNPTGNRFTGKRFEKALNVTLNSVVFRSSGQELTTVGTYIEMTSHLVEPALLALAVLAVRGRIKRDRAAPRRRTGRVTCMGGEAGPTTAPVGAQRARSVLGMPVAVPVRLACADGPFNAVMSFSPVTGMEPTGVITRCVYTPSTRATSVGSSRTACPLARSSSACQDRMHSCTHCRWLPWTGR
jgi:hypothetical protein